MHGAGAKQQTNGAIGEGDPGGCSGEGENGALHEELGEQLAVRMRRAWRG